MHLSFIFSAIGHDLFEKSSQDQQDRFEHFLHSTTHDLLQKCEADKKAAVHETLEAADAKLKKTLEDAKKAQVRLVSADHRNVN